jgi:glutamate 5-kinase
VNIAQVLLTRADVADRRRHLNARTTLLTLLSYGVVPIINENDTVAVEELAFGDNDTLSALLAGLISADLLVILSDIDGLYTADPRSDPSARLIPRVDEITSEVEALAGGAGTSG